jgi:CRISPR-associated endonuclease Cas1
MDRTDGTHQLEVAESASLVTETFGRNPSNHAVCVADGYGLRVAVERKHLVVADGLGRTRRARRFARATHGLSRLVVLGSTGTLSLEALHWCEQLGIGVAVLDTEGTRLLTSVPRTTDDARLRRMQAQAPDLPVGLDLARSLITDKLIGQARVLTTRFAADEEASHLLELAEALDSAASIAEVRGVESSGAALYWQSWSGRSECAPRFAAKDLDAVPLHWTRFDGRRSVLASANGNRKAERPVNALANYCYALLEIEAILSCHIMGLDPGLGLIHNDARVRQSLALDLMESARPVVDDFVLDVLERRTFRRGDFTETADGQCRILAPLTHELAEMMPTWAKALAPVAERVAHTLGQAMAGKYVPVTPLTTDRQRQAQAVVKARKTANRTVAASTTIRQRASKKSGPASWSCPDCGGPVTNHRHVRCDTCIEADPRQTTELRGRRGAAIAARKRALELETLSGLPEWADENWYRNIVLPRLASHTLREIMEAAKCSKASASTLRSGRYAPHRAVWKALALLAGVAIDHPIEKAVSPLKPPDCARGPG